MNIKVTSIAILVSLFAGFLTAFLFYFRHKSLKETASWLRITLYSCRFFIIFILTLLLFSPVFVQTKKVDKRPVLPILIDNSKSIDLADSTVKSTLTNFLNDVSTKVSFADVKILPFSKQIELGKNLTFDQQGTNISQTLDELNEILINQNIGAALLISDGINTEGLQSYKNNSFPIYTLGIGDSIEVPDAKIKKVYFNNVVFASNTFVTEAHFQFENLEGIEQEITIEYNEKVIHVIKYTPETKSDFFKIKRKVNAENAGVFPIDIHVKSQQNEKFLSNNSLKRFITVKSKKLKVLIVSDELHPDIRAVKSAFWGTEHIQISETNFSNDISLELINSVIFIGNSKAENKIRWLNKIKSKKKGFVWFTGTQGSFNNDFFKFIRLDESNDKVSIKLNPSFSLFKLENQIKIALESSIPLSVPFGKWKFKGDIQKLMFQKINSVETNYPQVVFSIDNAVNYAVYVGSDYWRIGIKNPIEFKKLIRKTINYISSRADNSQFRVHIGTEFLDIDEIIIDAEYYNKIGGLDNLGDVEVEIRLKDSIILNSVLQKTRDKYRLNIGRLPAGVYSVRSKFKKDTKEIIKKNSFFVNELFVEEENISLNYEFLSSLSDNSGGAYFDWQNRDLAIKSINSSKTFKTVSYFETITELFIKFKWIFYLLIVFVSIEWFLRKWEGVI